MLACLGCEWRMRSDSEVDLVNFVERYDRVESAFLTTGDYASLREMQTRYPLQTRRLIEDVLQLGNVDDAHINSRLYSFFQDSTLQTIISEVGRQYDDFQPIADQLLVAFERLKQLVPNTEIPLVYTQIGSLDQSVVVGNGFLGISLDKYLGSDYPIYIKYGYTESQRSMMTRDYIVPDCIGFYLLSIFPEPSNVDSKVYIGRVHHVVNTVMNRKVFDTEYVDLAEKLKADKGWSFTELLVNSASE